MKQWEEPESIRAIAERDVESVMSDKIKEIEWWKKFRLKRADALR